MKNFTFAKKIATATMFAVAAGTLLLGSLGGMSTLKAGALAYRVPCIHPVHPSGDIVYDPYGNPIGVVPCSHGTIHPFDWVYYR